MATKIAFILSNMDEDGGQTVVCTLLKNINRSKYMVKLFVLSKEVDNKLTRQLRAVDVDIQFVNVKHDYNYIRIIEIMSWLNRVLKNYKPDVINVHLDTLYSWIWALINRKRIIFTVHSEASRISDYVSQKLFYCLKKNKLIRVIGVSDFASKSFENVFGADNVQTIYNPVDIAHFDTERSIEQNEIRFINVARFYPVKNHKLLIEAFDKLHVSGSDARLILVGDGQEFENIKDYVAEKKLNDYVDFLGYQSDVSNLLRDSDVFVISSLSEAFPVSVIEALAVGLPIIATRVGGLPELVQKNGILVESGDSNALYQAMKQLEQDSQMRQEMARYSKEMSKNFSIEKILQQYEQVYDEEC